jgi:hypothetical protein
MMVMVFDAAKPCDYSGRFLTNSSPGAIVLDQGHLQRIKNSQSCCDYLQVNRHFPPRPSAVLREIAAIDEIQNGRLDGENRLQ